MKKKEKYYGKKSKEKKRIWSLLVEGKKGTFIIYIKQYAINTKKKKKPKTHKMNKKKRKSFFLYRLYIIRHSFWIKMNRIDEEEEEEDDGGVLLMTGEDNRIEKL